jgi:hypothetical protein
MSVNYKRLRSNNLSRSCLMAVISGLLTLFATYVAFAQTCPFDDGNSTITREGLVLTRFALGMSGASLVEGTDFVASDATSIANTINCPNCGLDINGNGGFDVVDATIITRKLAGLNGSALTDGLALGSGSRNTTAAVQSFLTSGCGLAAGGDVKPGFRRNEALSPAGSGQYSSMTIGFDGLPIIALYNQVAGDLQFAKCATIDCASATFTTIDSTGDVGRFPSMVIGANGNPVIAYYDATNTALKVAYCSNRSCSAANVQTVDSVNSVGQYASAVVEDGFVWIAYYDATNRDLKVALCGSSNCNSPTVRTLVSTGNVGEWSAATLVSNLGSERVAVAYYNATNREVRLALCGGNACDTLQADSLIEALGSDYAEGIAITTGRDGNAAISYTRKSSLENAGSGRIVICSVPTCATPTVQSVTGSAGNGNSTGSFTSISIAPDGLPFVAFAGSPSAPCVNGSSSGSVARSVKCVNPNCSIQTSSFAGTADLLSPSVTHGIDGMPIWSAWSCGGGASANGGNLMTVHCASAGCVAQNFRPR